MAFPAILPLLAILAAPPTLPPVDQCSADPSFVQFREQLRLAVERRDKAALLAMLSDEVLVDLGGGQGKEAVAAHWSLSDPASSGVWDELDEALSLGCALSGEVRILPSMIAQLGEDIDAYEILVATAPDAALRKGPSDDAEPLAQLQWDVLTVLSWPDQGDFVKVRRGGQAGHVRFNAVRSPLDFRLTVERVEGSWRITSFTAGD